MKPCYSCGVVLDPAAIPNYSEKQHRSGKFCPCCGAPLDADSASALALTKDYGPNTQMVRDQMISDAAAWAKSAASPA